MKFTKLKQMIFEMKTRLKYNMSKSIKCKRTIGALELWTALNGERDHGFDDVRDLITYKDDIYTGYFVMVGKSEKVLKEFIEDAFKTFDKEYVVFGREKDYIKYKGIISNEIGLICFDNLYGLGEVQKIMRESR